MSLALDLARPATEPDEIVVHPWLRHRSQSEDMEMLRGACRLAWHSREMHRSHCQELLPESADAFVSWETEQWSQIQGPGGAWDSERIAGLVRQFIQAYSAITANNLAASAACVWTGEYLYSLAPLVRAATEATTTGAWLLAPDAVSPRARGARLYLLLLGDANRAISAAQTKEQRSALKATRREITGHVHSMFDDNEMSHSDGGDIEGLADQKHPTLEGRFEDFGRIIGDPKVLKRYYLNLSQFAHPNPLSLQLLQDKDGYRLDPEDVHAFLRVGLQSYTVFLQFVGGYFGYEKERIEGWIEAVGEEFPGTFVD